MGNGLPPIPKAGKRPQPRKRCFCGRLMSSKVGARCSQEIRVYREGTFVGWEHR